MMLLCSTVAEVYSNFRLFDELVRSTLWPANVYVVRSDVDLVPVLCCVLVCDIGAKLLCICIRMCKFLVL
jgi:hypothetical protein